MTRPNVGHIYGRRSSRQQKDNTGKNRQEDVDFEGFCDKFGLTLSDKARFDDAYSAYCEANWQPDAALGQFLAAAKKGIEVRPGDAILIPNVDRLMRLKWTRAMVWVGQLFDAGVHIGDVTNAKLYRCDSDDFGEAIQLLCETNRGYGESKTKGVNVQYAKTDRLKEAMEGKAVLTQHLPFWIRIEPCSPGDEGARWYGSIKKKQWGRLAIKEPEGRIVREIFALAAQGFRGTRIVREMQLRGQRSPTGKKWSTSRVQTLLTDRRVLGELPASRNSYHRTIKKCPKSPHSAIADYYPRVVSDAEFFAAKGGAGYHHGHRGRDAAIPNVFKGLLFDALSGESYSLDCTKNHSGGYDPKLRSGAIRRGAGEGRIFDYPWFERCVLKELREVPVRDIIGKATGGEDRTELRGRLEENAKEINDIRKIMKEKRSSPVLIERVLELEAEQRELEEKIALAVHRDANPLSQAWDEQQSLLAAVENADDPVGIRVRLRQRLKETVDKIWLLVVPQGKQRAAAVQIDFKGGDTVIRRHYMFTFYPAVKTPHYSRPSRCEPVLSWRSDASWRGIDLASSEEAAALAGVLASGAEL